MNNLKKTGPGRPPVPDHLKRNKMTGIRIQQWMIDWLISESGSSGQIVEKALIEKYGIEYKETK